MSGPGPRLSTKQSDADAPPSNLSAGAGDARGTRPRPLPSSASASRPDGAQDGNGDGYTNLEAYLNALVEGVTDRTPCRSRAV